MEIRQLTDGMEVAQALMVRSAQPGVDATGQPCLHLLLGDRSGCVPATVGEGMPGAREACRAGTAVWLRARCVVDPGLGPRLLVEELRPVRPGETAEGDGLDGPHRPVELMEADLRQLVETVQEPHLRRLLDRVLGEGSETWARFRCAPAAKRFHQAYPHGLLEHSLTVAQGVSAISATFPGIDRDVAVTGALLHDIGKLDAYAVEAEAISMTDQGRLYGEIALGYYRIRREIEELAGFPSELAQALLHIILSHHGSLEHGSPVVPCTREATLVHMIDNLGGRLGSFDRLERELPAGAQWSGFDRALGAGAFFAPRAGRLDRAA